MPSLLFQNSKSLSNQCLAKVAELSAQLERCETYCFQTYFGSLALVKKLIKYRLDGSYEPAIEIFESLGSSMLENNLLRFNAKGHFLMAGILILITTVGR